MNVAGRDINQTLEYRSAAAIVRLLPTGLLLVFLGLLISALVVDPDRESVWTYIGVVVCLVLGGALVGFTLWRRSHPGKPLFKLSPDGVHYRIPLVKEVLIPWHQIQGVDTIDIEAGYWSISWLRQNPTLTYEPAVACNVTVILLPKPFYDQRIFVDSFLLRGPGWKANFIPKGSLVQMALHHESYRSSHGRSAKRSRRAGLHFATGPPASRRERACQVWWQRAIRTFRRALRLAPRRRQTSWRWATVRRRCRGGRPRRSLSC